MGELFNNYCIVGNSDSELHTNNGALIDSFDQIFRFNNFKLQKYEKDYGAYTTHWVTTFAVDVTPKKNIMSIVCPLPLNHSEYIKRYGYTNLNELEDNLLRTTFIPVEYYNELIQLIPNPSTGMCLLWWIKKENGWVDPNRVFGFDFFDENKRHHYFDEFSECYHDGNSEKLLFKQLCKR